jgi:pyruvate kinase
MISVVAGLVAYTSFGSPALRMARERPRASILGITPRASTARRLALVWGGQPVLSPDVANVGRMIRLAIDTAKQKPRVRSARSAPGHRCGCGFRHPGQH